jgi:helicase MOV-10
MFNVKFQLNRLVMRRMHQGLDSAFNQPRVLFPEVDDFERCHQPTATQLAAIRPGERKIASNPHQLESVAAILNLPPGSPPFVVFGPYVI